MYERFYGLSEKPFSLLPDPAFLYLGKVHGMALTMLQYGLVNRAAISLITGEIGSGKTTLIRKVLDEQLDDAVVGLISNTHESFDNLLQWVAVAFGVQASSSDKAALYDRFSDFLIQTYAANRRVVLVVDEAQNLRSEMLEELRLLSNMNVDKRQLLQIALLGQPELRSKLSAPGLEQFVQRISVDYHLSALSCDETCRYIEHRLKTAGDAHDIFSPSAKRFIHYQADGTPRLINQLCDTALVYGFAEQSELIDAKLVLDLVIERQKKGLFGVGLHIAGETKREKVARTRKMYSRAIAETS